MGDATQERSGKDSRWQVFLWVGLIVLITFLTYLPTWRNGFVWDDFQDVVDNQLLRTNGGLRDLWTAHWGNPPLQYYPLTFTTFWVDYHLWGLQPLGYHVINVLLHTVNAILVGVLLTRLSVPGAWLAALIFAVHPVQVESVAWITERKNVLSGLFFLLATLAYLRFLQHAAHRWRFYGLTIGLYMCALLSKTATVPLPTVLLVVLWWKREKINRQDLAALAPFFLLGAAMGILTMHFEAAFLNTQSPEWHLSLIQRFLLAGRAVWFYAGKMIWPHPVMIIYPLWQINASAWWQYLYPLGALGAILTLWFYRARLGKAPLAAVLFFTLMLAPILGFVSMDFMHDSFVMDHWQYLASIGLIALVVAGGTRLVRERLERTIAAATVVAVLCIWSWHHCEAFRSQETLYGEEVALNPRCWSAYYNLGNVHLRANRLTDAVAQYEQAIQLKPDHEPALNNLAFALLQLGRANEAVDRLEQVVRISPKSADAHYNLATTLVRVGRIQDAIGECEQVVRLKPDFAEAHYTLGALSARTGQTQQAVNEFLETLRLRPDHANAHYAVGVVLANEGQRDEALSHLERAMTLEPGSEKFRQALETLQQAKTQMNSR